MYKFLFYSSTSNLNWYVCSILLGIKIGIIFNSLYKDDIFISYLDLIKTNFTTFEQVYNFVLNGSYKIIVPANKYSSFLYGSLPYTELTFTIANGEYSASDYSCEYLIN